MDKITLECFVNKQTYQKYLAIMNPNEFSKQTEIQKEMQSKRKQILDRVEKYIDGKELETSSLKHSFREFMKECIEWIEREEEASREDKEEDEDIDDVLFSNIPKDKEESKDSIEYWKMEKVFKQSF
jgi:hypothetical protein